MLHLLLNVEELWHFLGQVYLEFQIASFQSEQLKKNWLVQKVSLQIDTGGTNYHPLHASVTNLGIFMGPVHI